MTYFAGQTQIQLLVIILPLPMVLLLIFTMHLHFHYALSSPIFVSTPRPNQHFPNNTNLSSPQDSGKDFNLPIGIISILIAFASLLLGILEYLHHRKQRRDFNTWTTISHSPPHTQYLLRTITPSQHDNQSGNTTPTTVLLYAQNSATSTS